VKIGGAEMKMSKEDLIDFLTECEADEVVVRFGKTIESIKSGWVADGDSDNSKTIILET
jgi:hypothetical protein